MGVVYRARQVALDRPVALKILPVEVGSDPSFSERFGREARALARLSHPRIVSVFDFGKQGKFYWFLMELVEGVNLRQAIRSGKLSAREALAIVGQVCEALGFAHDEGVVHRDIKPENVLLDRKGQIKIADFGLAKLLDPKLAEVSLTGSGQLMGTPHYMAPEQFEKPLEVDRRADIYSLGVMFYEMLTGELPLGRFAPPSEKVQVDARLDRVVLKTLEKDPGKRYQSAGDLKTDVETVARAGGGAGPGRGRFTGRRRVAIAIAILLLGGFVAGLLLGPKSGRGDGAGGEAEVAAADLLNPGLSYFEKEKRWDQIRSARAIDRILNLFDKKAAEQPKNAELQYLLGRACINKLSSATDAEKSVLGRKADEAFTRALSLNPEHWEARFTKALCLTFWPAFLGKQPECVRELETLLSQQEKSPQEEKFVQAYVVLGNLYLQYGDRAKALGTWKRGLVQFPGNPELSGKISELKE
jgi:hypothetical protein